MARKSPAKSVQYSRGSSITFGQVAAVLVLCSLCAGGGFMLGQMYPRPLLETFRSNVVSTGAASPQNTPWRPPADGSSSAAEEVERRVALIPVVPAIEVTADQVREALPEVPAAPEVVAAAPGDSAQPSAQTNAGVAEAPEVRVVARAELDPTPAASAAPVAVAADPDASPRAVERTPAAERPVAVAVASEGTAEEQPRVVAAPARGRVVPRQAAGGAAPGRAVEVASATTADDAERIRLRLRDVSVVAHVHAAQGGGFQLVVEGVTSEDEARRLQRLGQAAQGADLHRAAPAAVAISFVGPLQRAALGTVAFTPPGPAASQALLVACCGEAAG